MQGMRLHDHPPSGASANPDRRILHATDDSIIRGMVTMTNSFIGRR